MDTVTHPTTCRICSENCGLLIREHSDRTEVSGNPAHPISKGFVCLRAKNYGHIHRSPKRLKRPMLKQGDRFEPISYEDSISILAQKITETKSAYGAESICFYKGESLKHQEIAYYLKHLAYGIGSPNYISVGSLCNTSMTMGHGMTYGGTPSPDFTNSQSAFLWGTNPAISSPRTFSSLIKYRKTKKFKLVVVDPTRTQTARAADIHLQVKPGGDGFLALAFLKIAMEKKGLEPCRENVGFEQLKDMLSTYSLEHLLEEAGLNKDGVEEAWDLLYENRQTWTKTGLGIELKPTGVQTIRAIACLNSFLNDSGPRPFMFPLNPLPGKDLYPERLKESVGNSSTPLFTGGNVQGHGMFWDKAILHDDPYTLKFMLIMGGNPALTFPDSAAQKKSLSGLEFLAVFDLFMTETAQLADLILPAADMFDTLELHDYGSQGHPYLGLTRPLSSTPRYGYSAWQVAFDLAKELGLKELMPWSDNREAILSRLENTGIKLEKIEQSASATIEYTPVTPAPTPIFFASEQLKKNGLAPLPSIEEFRLPTLPDAMFPFSLSTGDRVSTYQHSQYRNIPEYVHRNPEPLLDMNPEDAELLGLKNGALVRCTTNNGSVTLSLNLCNDIQKNCLRMTHGWEKANANILTGLEHFDPVCGFPWLMSLPAKVEVVMD
ncbi:molybdopterin-dependent oxidoreductase [Desulfopila sp. IMCC35008]|uniref:molybdopterin-containing oxidoreductase family protein n=1 Tax=Desulfopila sp. IMCC35008 TaxID=2653858 RepID=UPI0013D6F331|nr:molybdopterin-dependent oxidoreductase [Desulfopila sp. IMCC35008]